MRGLGRAIFAAVFLMIAGLTLIGQIAIVTFGGAIFRVEPLSWLDWLELAAFTSVVLIFGHACKWLGAKLVRSTPVT